jgi:hypothetical protein
MAPEKLPIAEQWHPPATWSHPLEARTQVRGAALGGFVRAGVVHTLLLLLTRRGNEAARAETYGRADRARARAQRTAPLRAGRGKRWRTFPQYYGRTAQLCFRAVLPYTGLIEAQERYVR